MNLPISPSPVGKLLERELDSRDWSQADFAAVLDRPSQFVSEIVTGKKEITRESAAQIGAALDTTAQYWLNLQNAYLLANQERNIETQMRLDEVRRRARLNAKGPIGLLKKRGFLRASTLDQLELEVMNLFELESLDDEPGFSAAAKRANKGNGITNLQRAWVACVRKKAREYAPSNAYSRDGLAKLARGLVRQLKTPAEFRKLPDLLHEVGVRLVYVEALPGAKIDGCAMVIDGYPVIGLSGRGKRLDKIVFTLLHEIAHILLEHVDASRLIVESLDDEVGSELVDETDANRLAAELVFPGGLFNVPARVSAPWVEQAAVDHDVAGIIVVGHLQHNGRLDWRTTLAKNAPTVSRELTGWK
jgi:HTH-type transcriptional regulator/antitoxin HigA